MPEPVATTVATLVSATIIVPAITAFGIPLGLRADLMIAGFSGGLVSIILLATVPSSGDTWRALLNDTGRRMAVVFASSLTAGYLTPLAMLIANVPEPLLLGSAFVVGGGAQHVLAGLIRRFVPPSLPAGEGA